LATLEDKKLKPLCKLSDDLQKEGGLTNAEFENLVRMIAEDPKKVRDFLSQKPSVFKK
jgi:hypothetical protein